ncbi:transposase [Gemmatimonas sp.]|uniref:transposase n=1 Tax=Gemmatimonas sp. TaxID=1962908 RepID=UPI00356956CF
MSKLIGNVITSSPTWPTLETFVRQQVQQCVQQVLEEEVEALLGRRKSVRSTDETPVGYRNGHGKPRRLALMNGTITLRRPRVRGLEARFVSRIMPLFKRRTPEVAALLPELYLHGSATAGLETSKAALLVLIGGLADGTKVVLAVESGVRESTESWAMTMRDLTARGLRPPPLTCADGHLGIWGVETRADAELERQAFHRTYGLRYPNACERLDRDGEPMITYDAFPKEHWRHLRTTNVVESPFAAVRLRTSAAKRVKKVEHATAIIWRLLLVAESRFRQLNAPALCLAVILGVRYVDGRPAAAPTPALENAAA